MEDLQRIAEALADRLHRAVAIDDPQLHLLAHTSHEEEVDDLRVETIMRLQAPQDIVEHMRSYGIASASGPVRIPVSETLRLLARVCVPIRCQGLLLGYLWLLESTDELTDSELAAAQDAADAAGQVLLRQQLMGDLRDSRERELLRDLLADDPTLQHAAAAALVEEELVAQAGAVTAVAVAVDENLDSAARAAMDAVLRRVARGTSPSTGLALTRGNGRGLVLLCGRREPTSAQLRVLGQDLLHRLRALFGPQARVRVGVGPTVPALTDAGTSAHRAWEALAVSGTSHAIDDIAVWDELGVYKLIAKLPRQDMADTLPEGLVRLAQTDQSGVLVKTLETWLDEGGNARATIGRLAVHRTSLYYRIGRIEEITGMRLASGDDRLALHLGLKVMRLLGTFPMPH